MADKFMKSITFVEGGDAYYPLPKVTNADDGKVLKVVNGAWSLGEYPKILMRIEVTTSPTTVEYTEGDSLDLTGLVVTATFSDGSTEDITSQCIMSPAAGTALATTDTSISISYTYKGVTRSTAQIIAVEINPPYLSFIGNEDFTLKTYKTTKNWDGTLQYSTNGSTWNTWNGTEISSADSKLYLRGTGNTKITGSSYNYKFVFTGTDALKIVCKGNIENLLDYETVSAGGHPIMSNYCYYYMFNDCTSLTKAPALPATTLAVGCYGYMFSGCTSLTTAPSLPATTLAVNCYMFMFNGCTSLTTAPALPATTMAENCYQDMFVNCTALITAPALPATTLADYCYFEMFSSCTSLTTPPSVLPATTLAVNCYYYMFNGCTSLTTAPELPATTLAESCYEYMFYGCTSLTTAPELPATTLANYCYSYMFYGCTSLTTAPELPATTLARYCYRSMFNRCTALTTPPSVLPATTLAESCYRFMFEFTAISAIPRIMATTYATDSCKGMFDDIKTLNVYSTSGTGHTYGWRAPSSASSYCSGMFGSDDSESEWAKLDGSNFPNSGTPTDGKTYYFKTVA